MANSKKIDSNTILKAVDVLVNKRIEDLDLDKTIIATIDKALAPAQDGSHRVKYNGGFFTAYASVGTTYAPNTTVYVQIPQNNFSNRKIILGNASSYYVGNTIQTVSSAINDYSIIGTNTLKLINEEYAMNGVGLNSYSETKQNGVYQDIVLLYDRNRTNQVPYNLNIPQLETYIKDAKAVMLSADFRTSLDQHQQNQVKAEYGLIFNLIFKNKETVYFTNGELFTAVSNNVKAYLPDGETLYSIFDFQQQIEDQINNVSNFDILKDNLTTIYIKIINFLDTNKEKFTTQEKSIFTAYQFLIAELLNSENINNLIEKYSQWFDQSLTNLQDNINQPEKILSYVLDSSHMIGNPFLFSQFSNQYTIFPIDVEDFIGIDQIAFYCKGFIENIDGYNFVDSNKLKMLDSDGQYHGKDIWVKNVQFLALKEISSEYGDYKITVNTPNGAIFYSVDEEETLIAKAKTTYKEWTNINDNCTFYWFVKDIRVSSSQDDRYNWHGGVGWRYLGDINHEHASQIILKASDNKAYENIYLCAAVYDDGSGSFITLKEQFILYNEACKRNITIESDLGTKFKWDGGKPLLTCLIDGKESFFESNKQDNQFKFYWSKRTAAGEIFTFTQTYDEVKNQIDSILDYNTRISLNKDAIELLDVSYPLGVNGNKIQYPIKNIRNASQINFECQVYTVDMQTDINNLSKWYCIGTGSITLYNEDIPTLNNFTVVIDNANQIFQYSETGVSPLFAGNITPTDFRHTEPIEILQLKAHLYDPNGLEVNEGTYSVNWRYPIVDTLIVPPENLYENIVTHDFDMIEGQTTDFSIAPSYDYDCTNNQIQCIIKYGNETYTAYTDFYFGKIGDNGTNGTDIIAKIITINDNRRILDTQPLTVYEYKNGNEKRSLWNISTTSNSLDPILEVKLYNRSVEIPSSDFTSVHWEVLGGTNRSNYWEFDDTDDSLQNNQIRLHYNCEKNNHYTNLIIKATVTIKEKEYHCVYPICVIQTNGTLADIQSELLPVTGKNLLYLDNKKYLKQILYNADGRTPLYNKNQGVFLHGLEGRYTEWKVAGGLGQSGETENNTIPIRLLEEKDGIDGQFVLQTVNKDGLYILPTEDYNGVSCDNRVEIITYSSFEAKQTLDYIMQNIKNLADAYNENINNINQQIRQENIDYRNKKINLQKEHEQQIKNINEQYKNSPDELQIILNENNDAYTEQQNILLEEHNTTLDNYNDEIDTLTQTYNTESTAFQNSLNDSNLNKVKILVPIYMSLNVYGLASLNAWDGNHVDINEDAGYIVAPQIGAGKKENDNTFTGVVMGEMSAYGEDESDIGLLGLSHGKQSIFLDSKTGNAYFGLPNENKFGGQGTQGYNEGRIELVPGGVSKVGGWRLGRRSLYYTASGEISDPYNDNYATEHEHDIAHNDQGILLTAIGEPYQKNVSEDHPDYNKWFYRGGPYVSIKGRELTASDVNTEPGTNIAEGDSLELQLDPLQRSIFSIFRHRGNQRILLSGIDNKGRFIANRLQDGASSSGSGVNGSTSFSVSDIWAFGDIEDNPTHIGAQFEAGNSVDNTKTFISLFAEKNTVDEDDGTIYITGGEHGSSGNRSDYTRPLSIHGKTLSLYAFDGIDGNNNNKTSKFTNSKITLSKDGVYLGNVSSVKQGYLNISMNNNNDSEFNITESNINFNFGKKHNITVTDSYIFNGGNTWTTNVASTASISAKGNANFSSELNCNLYGENTSSNTNNYLRPFLLMGRTTGNSPVARIQLGYYTGASGYSGSASTGYTYYNSFLRLTPTNGSYLHSKGNFNLYSVGKMNITQDASNDGLNINSYNDNAGGLVYIRLRPNSGNTLNLNRAIGTINASNENENPQVSITTNDGAYIRHQWGIKPGLAETAAIRDSVGWAIKPGIQTNWIKIVNNSSQLYFNSHTISSTKTSGAETVTLSKTADNAQAFWQYIIDELAYVKAYSQDIWENYVSKLGTVAYWNSVGWSNISNKPSSFTPSNHTHTLSREAVEEFTSLTEDHKHGYWYFNYGQSTGGVA